TGDDPAEALPHTGLTSGRQLDVLDPRTSPAAVRTGSFDDDPTLVW
ncbi:MAG: hypothetical protein JWL64_1019, partial [Frankiales bacterium]|nr:hypothetical protein [Frankiales bacterium]